MKKISILFVVFISLVLFSNVTMAQSLGKFSGQVKILDTSGGSVNENWKKVYDFSALGADSSTTSGTVVKLGPSLAIGENETWHYDFYAWDSVSANTGIKFAFAIPSGATIAGVEKGSKKLQDTIGGSIITTSATGGATFTTYVPTSNYGLYEAHFNVYCGATRGTVASEYLKVSSGTAIVKQGATLLGYRIN